MRCVLTLSLALLVVSAPLRAQEMNRKPRHPGTSVAGETPRFKFAVITDRHGGRKKGSTVFVEAIDEVNLLDPDFTICVGDLIAGCTDEPDKIAKQWDELDRDVRKLKRPFYYVFGNHDASNPVMEAVLRKRYGAPYYSFDHKGCHFIVLFTMTFDATVGGGSRIQGVRIERWEGERLTLVRAREARFEGTELVLTGYRTQIFDLAALDRPAATVEERLQDLVRLDNKSANPDAELTLSVGVDEEQLIARFSRGGFEDDRSLTSLYASWTTENAGDTERRTAGVLLQRRLAEPFANLALLLVALPLSLGWARGRGVAFGLSLVVSLAWYLMSTLGQFAAQSGSLPVAVGPWIANVVLGVLGVFLLIRLRTR